jgi:hypothetical protein
MCRRVLGQVLGLGIDEQVRIHEDHRNASPSASSRASAISGKQSQHHRKAEKQDIVLLWTL